MRINYNALPEYKKYRKATKGKPGAKMAKRWLRARIKEAVRKARVDQFQELSRKQDKRRRRRG